MMQLYGDMSLRGDGKTIGRLDKRLSSAQNRLSQVDGSCSSALNRPGTQQLTVDETKSGLVEVGSQRVRVD